MPEPIATPKVLETLPADIYKLLDADTNHEVSEENVQFAGEAVKDMLRNRFKKREPRSGERVIVFSSLGKKDRQLWYKANKPETAEKMHGKQIFKFLYGDLIEVLMLFLAKETGHSVTHEQQRVELDGVGGYTDAVIDGIPVDCKSASPFAYKKFEDGGFVFDDPFGYVKQLSGYAHALGNKDKGAAFFVADKVAGDLCIAPLDKMTIEGNPPGPRIAQLKAVVAQPEPPKRCYLPVPDGKSGNMKLPVGCSYCEFKFECHKDANNGQGLRKYFYSRGPVFLTTVAREPKVQEVYDFDGLDTQ